MLDYIAIGSRVKSARTQKELTQDNIADMTGLSNSHISNVETGSTKVGLPTLVKIANAIEVGVDELLCDSLVKAKPIFQNEIATVTSDCTEEEIRIIADMTKALKQSLRNRVKP